MKSRHLYTLMAAGFGLTTAYFLFRPTPRTNPAPAPFPSTPPPSPGTPTPPKPNPFVPTTAVKLTSHISRGALQKTIDMAREFCSKGATVTAEDFLGVWLSESGVRSNVQNHQGAAYYGLNQMGTSELKTNGFTGTPQEYMKLTVEQQIPYVKRFYENNVRGFAHGDWRKLADIGSLYLMNFTPAYMPHADQPRWRIATKRPGDDGSAAWREAHKDDYYAWNRALDVDNKGYIEIADMAKAAEAAKRQKGNVEYWAELLARLREEEGIAA